MRRNPAALSASNRRMTSGSRSTANNNARAWASVVLPCCSPSGGFELSPRSQFGDDLLVEPSHGVDSERGEIEVNRLYPELAHGAQVVDDLGVAAGEQEPLPVVGLRGRRGSVAMDPKGERDVCRIAADVGDQLAQALDRRPVA